jgi:hypothetical protein
MKLRLIHFFKFTSLLLYLFVLSCEDVELAYPGNDRDTDPVAPSGTIAWAIDTDGEKGLLEENSASGKTIGTLSATDDNPDDEFTYSIKSQKIDNSGVNYFILTADSGNVNLVLNNGNLNYEALTGSREITVSITVTDDSPDNMTDDFEIKVEVINVNETPIFNNFNSLTRYADEYILYEFNKIEWSDTDDGQNPTLTSNGPSWLTITSEGLMSGTPQASDVGNNAYTITITDGEISVTEDLTINVRGNEAPTFTGSSEQTWEEERSLSWTISWSDPNSLDYSTMEASVSNLVSELTFTPNSSGTNGTVSGYLPTSYVNQSLTFSVTLNDNRAGNPIDVTESFTITVDPNDAPNFSNTTSIPQSINHGCPYYFDVNWSDPDGDNVVLAWESDVTWLNINSNGLLSGTPLESDIGSSGTVALTITDNRPNVPLSTDYSFSINVGENFAPVFTNSGSVDTTATVGEEYSFQFAINDENSDALTFTVPTRPSWLTYDASLYKIYGTPPDTIGTNDVTVKVEDCGTSTSFDFSIEVSE